MGARIDPYIENKEITYIAITSQLAMKVSEKANNCAKLKIL